MLTDGVLLTGIQNVQRVADAHQKVVAMAVLSAALEQYLAFVNAATPAASKVEPTKFFAGAASDRSSIPKDVEHVPCLLLGSSNDRLEHCEEGGPMGRWPTIPELPQEVTAELVASVLTSLDDRLKLVSAEATRVFSTFCKIAAQQEAFPVRSVSQLWLLVA
jgi:hypothetical protein